MRDVRTHSLTEGCSNGLLYAAIPDKRYIRRKTLERIIIINVMQLSIQQKTLVLPLKGVRVWIVRHLPSPRPCFRAGYWVEDDDDDNDDNDDDDDDESFPGDIRIAQIRSQRIKDNHICHKDTMYNTINHQKNRDNL